LGRPLDPYQQLIAAAEDAASAIDGVNENWEGGNLAEAVNCLDSAALMEAVTRMKKFLDNSVRNRGHKVELHCHDDVPLTPYEELFLNAARETYCRDGELEFDDGTIVSGSDDAGEYVMGWRWVCNEDVKFPLRHAMKLYYRDEDGVLHHIATDNFMALDQGKARELMLDKHWDDRLDAASCSPHIEWDEVELEDFQVTVRLKEPGEYDTDTEFEVRQYRIEDVRPAMAELFPESDYIIEIEGELWFRNKYRCPDDGTEWEDEHSAACNDRCPTCNKEIEPYESEDIERPEAQDA